MIVMDLLGDGIVMTALSEGVRFDLDADGSAELLSWTQKNSDDAILVLDTNGDGRVMDGSEVVGRFLRLPGRLTTSGAMALAYELQGIPVGAEGRSQALPAGVGELDKSDAFFARLQLWTDRDHDGRSTAIELADFKTANIVAVRTSFGRPRADTPASRDDAGNQRLFVGSFFVESRGVRLRRDLVEVAPIR